MAEIHKSMVPVQPNAATIRGRIVHVKPEGNGSTLEVEVAEARDVDGMANFVRSEVGKSINVYIHPELNAKLVPRDSIEAQIAYRGDEDGGRFVLTDDKVRKL